MRRERLRREEEKRKRERKGKAGIQSFKGVHEIEAEIERCGR